jgi:hypothetical protein
MAFVLAKRWKQSRLRKKFAHRPFRNVVRSYCSLFKPHAARPELRQLPWDEIHTEHAAMWKKIRMLVLDFEHGFLTDPCEPAIHWGSPEDHKRVQNGILKHVIRTCRFVKLEDRTVELNNYFYRYVL